MTTCPDFQVTLTILKEFRSPSTIRTLEMRCKSMMRPDLPGYLPAMLAGVISKSVAPSSVQIACTSIRFPLPCGPAISTERTKGVSSRSCSLPRGMMQYSFTICLISPVIWEVLIRFGNNLLLCTGSTIIMLYIVFTY